MRYWLRPLLLLALPLVAGCYGQEAIPHTGTPASEALAALPAASRAAVRGAPLPVLLFPAEYAEAAVVTHGPSWYAVSSRRGPLSLSIHATSAVHRGRGEPTPVRRPHTVRGHPALVLVNESIRSVTWEERGVTYVVELECFDGLSDERCTTPAFVLAEANALVEVPAR